MTFLSARARIRSAAFAVIVLASANIARAEPVTHALWACDCEEAQFAWSEAEYHCSESNIPDVLWYCPTVWDCDADASGIHYNAYCTPQDGPCGGYFVPECS